MKQSVTGFETRLSSAFEDLEKGISREDILKNFSDEEQEELEEILFIGDFLQAQNSSVMPRESALRSALSTAVLLKKDVDRREWGEYFSLFWHSVFRKKILIPTIGCFFLGALVIHPIVNSPENEIERLQETQHLEEEISLDYQEFMKDFEEYEKLKVDVFATDSPSIS